MGRHVILEKLEKNVCNKQKVGMRNVEKMHIGSNVQIVGLTHEMRTFEKKIVTNKMKHESNIKIKVNAITPPRSLPTNPYFFRDIFI